jgi:hypothetical protein
MSVVIRWHCQWDEVIHKSINMSGNEAYFRSWGSRVLVGELRRERIDMICGLFKFSYSKV